MESQVYLSPRALVRPTDSQQTVLSELIWTLRASGDSDNVEFNTSYINVISFHRYLLLNLVNICPSHMLRLNRRLQLPMRSTQFSSLHFGILRSCITAAVTQRKSLCLPVSASHLGSLPHEHSHTLTHTHTQNIFNSCRPQCECGGGPWAASPA